MDPHFVFAKTVADTPHYWVKRTPENEADYVALYNAIKDHGVSEVWAVTRHRYKYFLPRRLKVLTWARSIRAAHQPGQGR